MPTHAPIVETFNAVIKTFNPRKYIFNHKVETCARQNTMQYSKCVMCQNLQDHKLNGAAHITLRLGNIKSIKNILVINQWICYMRENDLNWDIYSSNLYSASSHCRLDTTKIPQLSGVLPVVDPHSWTCLFCSLQLLYLFQALCHHDHPLYAISPVYKHPHSTLPSQACISILWQRMPPVVSI